MPPPADQRGAWLSASLGAGAALVAAWYWRRSQLLQAEVAALREAMAHAPPPAPRGKVSWAEPPESSARSPSASALRAPSASAAAAAAAPAPQQPLASSSSSSSSSTSSSTSSASTSTSTSSSGGGGSGAQPASSARKPRRIYMDGCFDMLHYGHANALRQAKAVGDVLVVGLVNDAEIVVNKGTPPVMCEAERYAALVACKFVDEIIRDAPYNLHKDWVDRLVAAHGITYILHGDDPCLTADGQDAYAYAKQIGVYKQIKRTEGVSTTDIVGRMLLMTREHHVPPPPPAAAAAAAEGYESGSAGGGGGEDEGGSGRVSPVSSIRSVRSSTLAAAEGGAGGAGGGAGEEGEEEEEEEGEEEGEGGGGGAEQPRGARGGGSSSRSGSAAAAAAASAATAAAAADGRRRQARLKALLSQLPSTHSRFLPTARRIMQFAEGRVPAADDKVVYMPGTWDVFNPGHIAALAAARQQGSFLLVGIYDDTTINKLKGHGLPILNLYERALSLLSCKHVDEVIIGAPWVISEELIASMNIQVVVRGTTCDLTDAQGHARLGLQYDALTASDAREEAYAVPARLGCLVTMPSPKTLTALDIVSRILGQRDMFQARYEKKAASEEVYIKNKTYVQEG